MPEHAGLVLPAEQTGERLTEALVTLLQAPERYARMRKGAKKAAGYYSWDRTGREFLALLE